MSTDDEAEDKPLAASSNRSRPVQLLRLRSAGLVLHAFGLSFCVQGMSIDCSIGRVEETGSRQVQDGDGHLRWSPRFPREACTVCCD